jgi:hypothetical protein
VTAGIAWVLVAGAVFVGAGLLLRRVPARSLLAIDRRTGYGVYKRALASTGDEAQAVQAAAQFYKAFGLFFILFAALFTIVGLAVTLAPRFIGHG